jgi:mannose-6-phosphate isomerase-like protein (cupin superfamily)
MLIKDIRKCDYFKALDHTYLCEIFHPFHEKLDVNLPFSLAYATLPPGKTSKTHYLKDSTEIYYILDGTGKITIQHEQKTVSAGQVILIPPNHHQSIENIGSDDLKFLCIVSPPWSKENDCCEDGL